MHKKISELPLDFFQRRLSGDLSLRRAPTSRDGDDDGLATESQDRRAECRQCREHGYIERGVDQEGHEAEDRPDALRAVRARGEASLEVQGM